MAQRLGILVVGHGTSSAQGTAEFERVVSELREHFQGISLASGFLEFAKPTIDDAIELLTIQGVTSVITVPLLLFSAGHAKNDIPLAVQRATQQRGVSIAGQAEVLGTHPRLVELSITRYRENCETDAPEPAFVLVARGSNDRDAQRSVAEYVAHCQGFGDLSHASHAFLAMAQPSISTHLAEIAQAGTSHVVLVPHLLFHGELIEKCQKIVTQITDQYPKTRWKLAQHLGPHRSVVLAAADRIRAVMASILSKNNTELV